MNKVPEFVIRARRVVLPGETRAASIQVRGGAVVAGREFDVAGRGRELFEVGDDAVLMPGLVDTHVHVNEPGRAGWEGFQTATRAAAAGGVTTLIDMPLNSIPPTVTVGAVDAKRRAAVGQCQVDVGLWGGAVPGNLADLP